MRILARAFVCWRLGGLAVARRRVWQFFVGPRLRLQRHRLPAGEIQWVPWPRVLHWYGPPADDLHFDRLELAGLMFMRYVYGIYWLDNN